MNNELMSLMENYFPEDDDYNTAHKTDTRRPRLTFKHLNKMRKLREVKKLEMAAHRQFVKTMYGKKGEDEGLGF